MVDKVLNENTILEAQPLRVTYKKQEKEYVVGNFQEIDRAWKQLPFELHREAFLNQVCNGVFDKDEG